MRRLKGFIVSERLLGRLVVSGSTTAEVVSGAPESSKFVTAYFDNARGAFVCVYEDESFEAIGNGAIIPVTGPIETEFYPAEIYESFENPEIFCLRCHAGHRRGECPLSAAPGTNATPT